MCLLFRQLKALEVSALVASSSFHPQQKQLSPLEEIQLSCFAQQLSDGSSSTAAAVFLQKKDGKGNK